MLYRRGRTEEGESAKVAKEVSAGLADGAPGAKEEVDNLAGAANTMACDNAGLTVPGR